MLNKNVLMMVTAVSGMMLASCNRQPRIMPVQAPEAVSEAVSEKKEALTDNYGVVNPSLLASDQLFANHQVLRSQGVVAVDKVWRKKDISVCIMNPEAITNLQKTWMQESLERSWSRFSQVYFTGWGGCVNGAGADVRIQFDDSRPRSYVGSDALSVDGPSVWLNVNYCADKGVRAKACTEAVIAHEFGHVLGFQHEQLRQDTPPTCVTEPEVGVEPMQYVGEWDLYSIMNYCNPHWNNFGRLTETDKAMVAMQYESPVRGPSFDALFYINNYPDVKALVGGDQNAAYQHWLNVGQAEGRRGAFYFDPKYYLKHNPDVRRMVGAHNYKGAAEHWETKGVHEGRRASYEFDPRVYMIVSPDVRRSFGPTEYWMGIQHFMTTGLYERRQSSADFMIGKFIEKNPLPMMQYVYTTDWASQSVDEFKAMIYWTSQGHRENRPTR